MLRSFKWLLGEALHKPRSLFATIKSVVTAPAEFGRAKIEAGPRSLQRANAAMLKIFSQYFACSTGDR